MLLVVAEGMIDRGESKGYTGGKLIVGWGEGFARGGGEWVCGVLSDSTCRMAGRDATVAVSTRFC